jgi:hypothetical protein
MYLTARLLRGETEKQCMLKERLMQTPFSFIGTERNIFAGN